MFTSRSHASFALPCLLNDDCEPSRDTGGPVLPAKVIHDPPSGHSHNPLGLINPISIGFK